MAVHCIFFVSFLIFKFIEISSDRLSYEDGVESKGSNHQFMYLGQSLPLTPPISDFYT